MSDVHVISGQGAPNSAPPSLSAHYFDVLSGNTYFALGTKSKADWVMPEKPGAGAAAVAAHAGSADPHTQYQQKVAGKGLSTNDYTTAEKNKLASVVGNSVVTVTADTTLDNATHNGAHIVVDATADVVLTVPSSGFTAGAGAAIEKVGSGKVAIKAASGATLRFPASHDPLIAEKYGVARLKAVAAGVWNLTGDLMTHTARPWLVIGGGYTNGITIFDTLTMERIAPSLTLTNSYGKPDFSPDRSLLAVGYSASPFIVLFNTADWSQKYDGQSVLPTGAVNDVAFSPDGKYLAAVHNVAPYLTVWRTSDWSTVTLPSTSGLSNALQLAWSPDSTRLVFCGSQPYIKTLDTATWGWAASGPVNIDYAVSQMEFSPDGKYLATMQAGGNEFVIYNTADWTARANLPSRPSSAYPSGFFWSPDSTKFVAAGNIDPFMAVYETTGWTKISNFPVALTRAPDKVAMTNDTLFSFYSQAAPYMVRHKLSDWTVLPDMAVPFVNGMTVKDVEMSKAL